MSHRDAAHVGEYDDLRGPAGKLEVIRRLCALLYEVHDTLYDWSDGPCDCFCPDRDARAENFRSTGQALRFLEKTIRDALGGETVECAKCGRKQPARLVRLCGGCGGVEFKEPSTPGQSEGSNG